MDKPLLSSRADQRTSIHQGNRRLSSVLESPSYVGTKKRWADFCLPIFRFASCGFAYAN
ncbi:hypothetical protein RSSM_04077 [Rhodopirellula sallentina SM41]|uniref:Uncharacterized protein n=1 Tax=Rhodopirellula sallentina SM41 TaxID=1263870 RepID=M5TZ36_9BACT|nr:hypothetical protein RSSM_04077 [Rhodopirellula sallentina SM41]